VPLVRLLDEEVRLGGAGVGCHTVPEVMPGQAVGLGGVQVHWNVGRPRSRHLRDHLLGARALPVLA